MPASESVLGLENEDLTGCLQCRVIISREGNGFLWAQDGAMSRDALCPGPADTSEWPPGY